MTIESNNSGSGLQTNETEATAKITSPSAGKSLSKVVSGASGLSVSSTSAFTNQSGYLLLNNANESFALISYGGITKNAFNKLAQYSGNGTTVLTTNMDVDIAEQGKTPVGSSSNFGASSFTIQEGPNFVGTGYICILGAGGNGIFKYDKTTSILPTSTQKGVLNDCIFLEAFSVAPNQDPFKINVPSETTVIESSAPTQGITITSEDVTVVAKTPFTLNVVSTSVGFSTATEEKPGFLLMKMSDGSTVIVNYTNLTATSFEGATCETNGTFAAGTSVESTANNPITFGFTNNASDTDEIYVAIAGQKPDETGKLVDGYLTQSAPGQTLAFTAITNETIVPTFTLFKANSVLGTKTNLIISNSPSGRLNAFRIVFSIGKAPVIDIHNGQPYFPGASNSSDPNDDIIYDFVEFTQRSAPNDGVLFINTTQVDQVGIPFEMQTVPTDSIKTNGVGITKSYTTLKTDYASYIKDRIPASVSNNPTIDAFTALAMTNRILNPADAITNPPGGTALPSLDTFFDVALTTFYNKYIGAGNTYILNRNGYCFSGQTITGYSPASYSYNGTCTGASIIIPPTITTCLQSGMKVTGTGVNDGTTISAVKVDSNGTTVTLSTAGVPQTTTSDYKFTVIDTYTVLQLTEITSAIDTTPVSGGQVYQIYAPYFGGDDYPTNFPIEDNSSRATPPTPPWIDQNSAGRMVFGNLGAFADGSFQANAKQLTGTNAGAQILLDIENTIVSAFNRGVANSVDAGQDVTAAWNDNKKFYAVADAGSNWSNYYAGFLHNDKVSISAPGSSVGLAYGFAYDDQGDNDPTLASIFPTEVNINFLGR